MSSTVALTGFLPFVVLAAALLAFPICFSLLKLYRRSVQKGMASIGGGQPVNREPTPAPRAPVAQLRILAVDGNSMPSQSDIQAPTVRRAVYGPWRAAAAYAIAGLAYALVMTTGWLAATRDDAIIWTKLLLLSWTYFWPAVLTVLLVAAYDRRRRVQLLGAYFAVVAILTAIAVARNPEMGIGSVPLYWVIMNGPPTVLLRVFALAKRSEQLFDKLRRHWQYAGSISMIAGPDLVTTTIEPHEFLDFVSGRLGRQFVRDKHDLERRIEVTDKAPDPDGRYQAWPPAGQRGLEPSRVLDRRYDRS